MNPSLSLSRRLLSRALPVATLAVSLSWSVSSARAQAATTDAWAGATGNWDVPANWTNGVPTSGATNVLEFGNGSLSTGSYTATDNLVGAFQLNGINFTATAVTALVAASSSSNTAAFVANGGTSPFINVTATTNTAPSYGINSSIGTGANLSLFGTLNTQLLIPAVLSGAGSVTVALAGTVNTTTNSTAFAFQGINTFSGGFTLNADRIAVTTNSGGTPGAVTSGGFGTGTVNWNGGYIRTSAGTAHTVSNAITIGANANIGLGDNITVSNAGATLTLDGATTLAGAGSTATFNVAASANSVAPIAFAGAIGDGGGGNGITIAASGTQGGTVTFSGAAANTYTGLTTVGGTSATQSSILLLNKTAGTNAIGGSLQINQFGTVRLGASNQIPDAAVVTFGGAAVGGTFDLAGNSETVNSIVAATGGTITSSVAGTATLTLNNTTAANSGVNSTYLGSIQNGTGTVALVKNGADTLVLGNASSNYSGGTTVNTGGLAVGNAAALGTGSLTINNGATFRGNNGFTGTLPNAVNINGNVALGIATTAGTVTFTSGVTLGGTASSSRALTITGTTAASTPVVFSGAVGDGGNAIGITLASGSTSTLVLGGANTYTGPTAINGGTLLINGNSSAATGAVTVGLIGSTATGTLGGMGTVGGATTVNAKGMLAAGVSSAAATLTFSNSLTLGGTAAFDATGAAGVGNKGATYDLVNVNGALTYGGALTLNLNGTTPAAGSQYDLFDAGSVAGGTFSSIAVTGGGSSFGGSFDYSTGILTLTAVPEPSTWMGGLLVLGGIGWSYRRNRQIARRTAA